MCVCVPIRDSDTPGPHPAIIHTHISKLCRCRPDSWQTGVIGPAGRQRLCEACFLSVLPGDQLSGRRRASSSLHTSDGWEDRAQTEGQMRTILQVFFCVGPRMYIYIYIPGVLPCTSHRPRTPTPTHRVGRPRTGPRLNTEGPLGPSEHRPPPGYWIPPGPGVGVRTRHEIELETQGALLPTQHLWPRVTFPFITNVRECAYRSVGNTPQPTHWASLPPPRFPEGRTPSLVQEHTLKR